MWIESNEGMSFEFNGKSYIANLSANEIYGDGRVDSPNFNLSIQLPDGRFIQCNEWLESFPPQPTSFSQIARSERTERFATEPTF